MLKNVKKNIADVSLKCLSCIFPVDTRRRFNFDKTWYDVVRRHIEVETTSCVYRVKTLIFLELCKNYEIE